MFNISRHSRDIEKDRDNSFTPQDIVKIFEKDIFNALIAEKIGYNKDHVTIFSVQLENKANQEDILINFCMIQRYVFVITFIKIFYY